MALRGPALLDPVAGGEARIDTAWRPLPLRDGSGRTSPLGWMLRGVGVLLGVWGAADIAGFVEAQFAYAPWLGWAALGGVGAGLGAIGVGLGLEWRSLRRLRSVEGFRALLADPAVPVARVRAAALRWVDTLPRPLPEDAALREEIAGAGSAAELRVALRARAAGPLRERARQAGLRAAMEGGALVAVVPAESLDGLAAAWRGWRLVRQVAAIHGLRPGPLVLGALLRRIAWTAASVAGTELLAQSVTDHALSEAPIFRHFARASGVGVAAYRLYRLAAVTAEACSPLGSR